MSGGFRDFRGRVALIALLRVAHVAGVVGVGAALLDGRPPAAGGFLMVLVASGAAIAVLDAWSNRAWVVQASGLAILAKMGLLAALLVADAFGAAAFWGLLAFSVAAAHAPGRVRHRRLLG